MKELKALPIALIVLGISLILRAMFFLQESPSFYEISTYEAVHGSVRNYVLGKEIGLVPPLYYIPARLIAFLGSEPWLPRILSLVLGLLAPFVMYRTTMSAFDDRRLAWGSAFLLALNPYHVVVSCSMTPDALGIVITCCALTLFFRTLNGRRIDWVVYLLVCLALMHTHAGAPWVVVALFVCHAFHAVLSRGAEDPYPAMRWVRLERVFFYYFVLCTLAAPWRIRMDSWVPWHVQYANAGDVLHYLITVPFYGVDTAHTWVSLCVLGFLLLVLFCSIPYALFLSRRVAVAVVGCVMAFLACYGYVQIDRTYFLVARDAPLVLPFVTLAIITLCGAIPFRKMRLPVFLGFVFFLGVMSVRLSSSYVGIPWLEISRAVERSVGEKTMVAFWPNYTSRYVGYELPKMRDRLVPVAQMLHDLDEPSYNRDVLFVITDSLEERPGKDELIRYGWPGAIASHSTATLVWRRDNNIVVHARDIEWAWLRTWVDNPLKLALADLPTPRVTQFIWTPSNLIPDDPEEDPGTVFNRDEFAWNTPALAFDNDGRRVVWTTRPEVDLTLPVTLYPGKYALKLAVGSMPDFLGDAATTRTVNVTLASGEKSVSAKVDAPMVLSLPLEVAETTYELPVRLQVDSMFVLPQKKGLELGMKISSIRVDEINDTSSKQ